MARKLLGDALYVAGKESEAEESLKSALAIDPKHEPSLYALGRIYYQEKRLPEAEAQFKKVLEVDPKNHRAYDNLGVCYDAMHRDSDALRCFLKALELVHTYPEYDWAHANLAAFFLRREEFEKAFQFATEAAQRNPQSARNFFLSGKALIKLNKENLSVRWLERAVELDANYREARYVLAQTYRRLGRKEDAARELAAFQSLGPSVDTSVDRR